MVRQSPIAAILCVIVLAMSGALVRAGDPTPDAIIAGLTRAITHDGTLDPPRKAAALQTLAKAGPAASDKQDALIRALAQLHPEFAQAMEDMGDEDWSAAVTDLHPLIVSKDPYLAEHAIFFLARAYLGQDDYELALGLLQDPARFTGHSLQAGEALFLKGVCLRRTLQRPAALAAFVRFIKDYPSAPERLRVGALQQVYELERTRDGTLDDVTERMQFSEDRLDADQTDRPVTQAEQDKIVAILDKMIKDQENRENQQGQGGAGGSGRRGRGARGNPNRPTNPASESQVRPGQVPDPNLQRLRGSDPSWVRDKERQREKIFEDARGRVSDRDRELVEQYFKNLMDPNPPAPAEVPAP